MMMRIMTDERIKYLAQSYAMLFPFIDHKVKEDGLPSHGLQSYGYDCRVHPLAKTLDGERIDLLGDGIAPMQTVLCMTVEVFRLPKNVIVFPFGKSTNTRRGILINATPFEPGWAGNATIAVTNLSAKTVQLAGGFLQAVFFEMDDEPNIAYSGAYQDSVGIVQSIMAS